MLEIKRNNAKDGIVFEATQDGELIASASARLSTETLYIESFSGDPFLFDGMCRALMNFAANRSAQSCVICKKNISRELLSQLGVGYEIPSIEEFLTAKKCCGHCE